MTALFFLPRADASAQESTAMIRGTVRDQRGAPIPGVSVAATHPATGMSQAASTGEEGRFEIPQLLPGTYDVQVSRAGFATHTREGLDLSASQTVTLQFMLEAASEPSTVNLIREDQLVGLPLNGRSYNQLATLQAGVADPVGSSAAQGGGSGNLTVAGGRSSANNFLLYGTNIMDTGNAVPLSASGVQLGADAVLQVHVFSPQYGAEYGRGSGGVLNSVTRSGTNEFHASFFEYFRNSKLDARNFFNPGTEPLPFKRNQFGFTLAGPIRRDKTYFMGNFEGMRNRLTTPQIDFFPDELARQGIITDCLGNVRKTVSVAQTVKPYMNLYPLPNSGCVGDGFGKNSASQFLPTDEIFFTGRIDHQLSERDSLFARYTFDDATSTSPQDVFLWTTQTLSRQQYLTLVATHIFNPGLLTSLRFGYTRPVDAIDTLSSLEIPLSLFFVPGAPQFGQISIPGLDTFGPFFVTPEANVMNSFQFADDVVVQRGAHALKFGFEAHRYRWEVFNSFTKGGVWSFNSLESFLQGGPQGTNLAVALPGSNNRRSFRQTLAGFYAQDSYTVSPNFQVNLGLRYEFATIIKDRDGKTVFLPDPVHDQELQIGSMLKDNPSLLNFSPRLGIAWTPYGSRSFVLRAGFGIYYNQLLEYMVDLQKNSAPFYKRAVRVNFDSSTTFPDAAAAAAGLTFNTPFQAEILDYQNMTTPRVLRYNLALEKELAGGWSLQASYVGARGNHLFRGYEANLYPVPITQADGSLFFPPDVGPINPAFGAIAITSSDAQSFYNALQLSASRSFSGGISLRGNYTYSKSMDDASTFSSGSSTASSRQYPLMRTLDRALSDYDIRHRFVINYFYDLPIGEGHRWLNSGVLSYIFGGWRLGGIMRFRSGTPFHPQINFRTLGFLFSANRPSLRPGRSNNPVLGGPERYFDPSAFNIPPPGTLGNVGRNTIIGPRVFNLDVSLQKEFLLDSKRRLEFRAEFFNLPNHTNFAAPGGASTDVTSGAASGTAGRITRTATPSRQIQFALRLTF